MGDALWNVRNICLVTRETRTLLGGFSRSRKAFCFNIPYRTRRGRMGFFENIWNKIGFKEAKDTQQPDGTQPQEAPEQGQSIEPTIEKEEILQPLNIFLKKVVSEIKLPSTCSAITQTIHQYAQNPSLSLDHFEMLVSQIQEKREQIQQQKRITEQEIEQQAKIQKAVAEVEGQKSVLQQIQGNNEMIEEITHENFLESPQNKQLVQIQQFLKHFNDNGIEKELSEEIQGKFHSFQQQMIQVGQNVDEFRVKITEFQKEENQLKEDIQNFSKVLAKVNSMGNGAMEQYRDQLTQSQKELNERREEYLKGEEMINKYVGVLNGSVMAYVQSFKSYIPVLQQAIQNIMEKINAAYGEVLQKNTLKEEIQTLDLSQEQLQKLQYKITEFAQLHRVFTPKRV